LASLPAVLHIFGKLDVGGAERRTLDLARTLSGAYVFHFLSLSSERGSLCDEIEEAGGIVHLCPAGPSLPWTVWRVLAAVRPVAIDSHVHYASGLFLLFAALARIKTRVAHFRSTSDGQPRSLARHVQRQIMRGLVSAFSTHIVGVSEGVLDSAWPRWRSDSRCQVLYNGVQIGRSRASSGALTLREELGLGPHTLLIVTVGSLNPAKNQLKCVEIAHQLQTGGADAAIVLVGRSVGTYGERVRELARHVANVHWVGERSDIAEIMKTADVLLLPSVREGLPGVVLEACAVGLPVVASDLPGVREIARYFPTVRIVATEADAETWSRAISVWRTGGIRRDVSAFEISPFTMAKCATQFAQIMEGR